MDFNEYQNKAKETAIFPDLAIVKGENIGSTISYIYPALGLVGEAGEVAEKIKKLIRDKDGVVSEEDIQEITKELGDIQWYIAALAGSFGIKLDDIANKNIEKLESRKSRNVIKGNGDNR